MTQSFSVFMSWGGVVAAASLDFVVGLFGFDFYFSKTAVAVGVCGRVSDVVLAAEFLGNLIEGLAEFFYFVADFDHAATGFLGEFLHVGNTSVAADTVRE